MNNVINGNSEMTNATTLNLLFFILYHLISFLPKYLIETHIAKADIITAHGTNENNDSVLPVSVVITVCNAFDTT